MKIFLCSDILVTSINEQDNNLIWLRDLLAAPIARSGGDVTLCSHKLNKGWDFNRDEFFRLSNISPDKNAVQFSFKAGEISAESARYLLNFIPEDAIVAGYELSEYTRRLFDRIGVRYVDIWLGPIRFLDDVTFAVRSNDKAIDERIASFVIDDDLISTQASLIKVQNYRGFNRVKEYFMPDTAVFAGQVMADKAILRDNRFLNVLDYKDEFKEICRRHKHVIYCRHPYLKGKNLDDDVIDFVKGRRNTEIMTSDLSFYQIITDDNITGVYSISSSVVAEARYFGKTARYLFKPVVDIDPASGEPYRLVSQQILNRRFWDAILNGSPAEIAPFWLGKNKIRHALSFYWSYRTIDKNEYIANLIAGTRK